VNGNFGRAGRRRLLRIERIRKDSASPSSTIGASLLCRGSTDEEVRKRGRVGSVFSVHRCLGTGLTAFRRQSAEKSQPVSRFLAGAKLEHLGSSVGIAVARRLHQTEELLRVDYGHTESPS
jgi:hypothetical protein